MADQGGDEDVERHVVVTKQIGTSLQACCFTCKTFLSKQGGRWKYVWAALQDDDGDEVVWHCEVCGITTSSRAAMLRHVSVHAQPKEVLKALDPPIAETLAVIQWCPTNADKSEWRPASCPAGQVTGSSTDCIIKCNGSRQRDRVFSITGSPSESSIVYNRWMCTVHHEGFGPGGPGEEHYMSLIRFEDGVKVPDVVFIDRTVYTLDFIYYIMSIFYETFCIRKVQRTVHRLWEDCYMIRYKNYDRELRAYRRLEPLVPPAVDDPFPDYQLGDKFQNRNTIMELLCEVWRTFPEMRAWYLRDIEIIQKHFTQAMAIDDTYDLARRQRVVQRAVKEGETNQFWVTSACVFNVMSSVLHMIALTELIPNHSDTIKKKYICKLFRNQNKDRTTQYIAVDNIKSAQDNLIQWHGEVIIDERNIPAKPLTVGADLFHISQIVQKLLPSSDPDRAVASRAVKQLFARIKEGHPAAFPGKDEYKDAWFEWKTTYERATATAMLCTQSDIATALTLLKKSKSGPGPLRLSQDAVAGASGAGAAGAGASGAAEEAAAATSKKRREIEIVWDAEQMRENEIEHRKRHESDTACDKCGSRDFQAAKDCMLICDECYAGIHVRCLPSNQSKPKASEGYWCERCLQNGAKADQQARAQQAAKRSRDGAPSSKAGIVSAAVWAGIEEAALHPTVVQGLFAHRQYRDWLQLPGTNPNENFHMVTNGCISHNQGHFRPDHLPFLMEMSANKYNNKERPNALLRTPLLAEDPYFVGLCDRSVAQAIKRVAECVAQGESTRAPLRLCPASVHETYDYDEWVEDNGPVTRQASDRWPVDDMNELQALCDKVTSGEVILTEDQHANFYKYVQAQPTFTRRKKRDIQAMLSKILSTRMEAVRDEQQSFSVGDLQRLIAEHKAANSGEC